MTLTVHIATPHHIAAKDRDLAIRWLRAVAHADPPLPDAELTPGGVMATACELRLCIVHGKRPMPAAEAWLRRMCGSDDLAVRASARGVAGVLRIGVAS